MGIIDRLGDALLMALGMFWKTGWTLVLGFAISAALQTVVPNEALRARLGKGGPRQIGLAALLGAASSSCSFASTSITRTLFRKGAALEVALAFLFASTNLVIELGIVLYLLMGWQFMVAEWVGGIVLILVMSLIVKATYPAKLAEDARSHMESGDGHGHGGAMPPGEHWWQRLASREGRLAVARHFTMDWSMLWKDLAIGFAVGGLIAAFVPDSFWHSLFLSNAPAAIQIPANAILGPIVASLTFLCSIGNVPLAAILWASGATFGGVIAFIYGDLIILPLLDAYRRYFGLRMAAYIGAVLYASMVIAAILVDLGFNALGLVPQLQPDIRVKLMTFSIDYTFWLNIAFGALAIWLYLLSKKQPAPKHHCCH
ncbi:permease [Stakelama sediminis]|uniref:Permease n=1 Tax=Stakelama sediminis TaxID=463200 RepID=A0A840Z0Q9_9SPHN|nr:permease [Stakelama sediminis]MBB5719314.1 hypothetical protein [Stakelama sediminis]